MINTNGCDLSHFQPGAQFHVIAKRCGFVYLKATEGVGFVDQTFNDYRDQANQTDLRVGSYHFLHPTLDGKEQAKHFIAVVGDLQPGELAPACDVESTPGWTAAKIQVVEDFVAAITERYHECKIYCSPGWWDSTFDGVAWSLYPTICNSSLWLAQYDVEAPRVPKPFTAWQIWQYCENGSVPGVKDGNVDTDIWNGEMPAA